MVSPAKAGSVIFYRRLASLRDSLVCRPYGAHEFSLHDPSAAALG